MTDIEVLHSKFDLETHKKTFVCYLEVIILEDGTIEYAVPSHQQKLLELYMKKYNVKREDVMDMCPPEYYFSPNEWLCKETGAISVWDYFFIGNYNEKQKEVLEMLKKEKLYMGEI